MVRFDQPMLDRLAAERVSSTKLYNYDMIVALSQSSINTQLEYLNVIDDALANIKIDLNDSDNEDEWTGL